MDRALRHRINAGRSAVSHQVSFFRKQHGNVPSEWKEDDSRVTFADFAISEKIFAELRNSFPEDGFCSEESNPLDEEMSLEAKYTWVLDPIDGTNNYALGLPYCAISLALLKKGEPVYGVIYDMSRDMLLEGGPELGLLENGKKRIIDPNRPFERRTGLVGMHFPVPAAEYKMMEPLLTHYRVRSMGSGALNLAYAALGHYDGCVDFKVKIWDIAAACALLRASGQDINFLYGAKVFPLRAFHVNGPVLPYFAGSTEFCRYFTDIAKAESANNSA